MFVEKKSAPSISSGTLTLNLDTSTVFEVTVNANITTLTISNPKPTNDVTAFVLILVGDGTPRTINWGSSVKWAGGVAPTCTCGTGKKDILSFISYDNGTTWLAVVASQNF